MPSMNNNYLAAAERALANAMKQRDAAGPADVELATGAAGRARVDKLAVSQRAAFTARNYFEAVQERAKRGELDAMDVDAMQRAVREAFDRVDRLVTDFSCPADLRLGPDDVTGAAAGWRRLVTSPAVLSRISPDVARGQAAKIVAQEIGKHIGAEIPKDALGALLKQKAVKMDTVRRILQAGRSSAEYLEVVALLKAPRIISALKAAKVPEDVINRFAAQITRGATDAKGLIAALGTKGRALLTTKAGKAGAIMLRTTGRLVQPFALAQLGTEAVWGTPVNDQLSAYIDLTSDYAAGKAIDTEDIERLTLIEPSLRVALLTCVEDLQSARRETVSAYMAMLAEFAREVMKLEADREMHMHVADLVLGALSAVPGAPGIAASTLLLAEPVRGAVL